MRISRDELSKFDRSVAPPPKPIEPRLPPPVEAAQIARDDGRDATIRARRERVLALLRRPATPEGEDAELIALLAAARALPLETSADRLSARQRLMAIGNLEDPPPEVRALQSKLRTEPGNGVAFADALLPARHDGVTPFHWGASGATGSGSAG